MAILFVLMSGLIHSLWNLLAKQSMNKAAFLFTIHLLASVVFLPFLVIELKEDFIIDGIGVLVILGSMILHGLYFALLARLYTVGDLSQFYPLMRGTSAILIPIISVLFLGEHLSLIGWISLSVINIGIFSMTGWTFVRNKAMHAPIWLALGIGMCITSYVLVDYLALHYLSPLALTQVHNFGTIIALLWGVIRSGQFKQEWQLNWATILVGAAFVPGSYMLFLFAMNLAQVAQLAPIREVGIVFGTVWGIFILKEQQGRRRIIASVLIAVGIITLGIWG